MNRLDNNYFAAQFPTPYRILGLPLQAFSLGHYCLLAHPVINCAFVAEGDASASLADLVIGVLICSKTYEEGKAFLESDWTGEVKAFATALGEMAMRHKKKLLIDRMQMFADYIRDGSKMPQYWEVESDGQGRSGAHWTQAVKLILGGELGYAMTDVYNMPLTQAFADYFKFAENHGRIQLMSADEIQMMSDEEEQEKAALEANGGAKAP